jgi:hypothetical protein
VNTLNKQSQTANRGWFSSLGVGLGADSSSPYKRNHVISHTQKPQNQIDPYFMWQQSFVTSHHYSAMCGDG